MNSDFVTEPYSSKLQNQYSNKFDCGNSAINSFLKNEQSLDPFFGKTYVLISEESIVGYYNISTGHIEDNTGIRLGGSIYLNYFALDKDYHKVKLDEEGYVSDFLLSDCFNRITHIQERYIGFSFITLSSTSEGYNLYRRNGFEEMEEDMRIAKNDGEKTCIPMYLPIGLE
ncbi:MAG: N-acetyltransferase [Ruminococcus sp.]|nr:N-acetyltransferase [Ruminococcus sp.]